MTVTGAVAAHTLRISIFRLAEIRANGTNSFGAAAVDGPITREDGTYIRAFEDGYPRIHGKKLLEKIVQVITNINRIM